MIGFILRAESAAQREVDAETGKECAADHFAFRNLRLRAITDGDLGVGERDVGHYRGERTGLTAHGVVDGVREGLVGVDGAGASGRVGGFNVNEAIGFEHGQGAEEHRVHDAEDGRIRAHAESQRQNRRDGKARALAQGAEGEAEIAEGLVEEGPAVVEIEALLRYADVAELAAGLTAGFFIAETFAFELVGFEFKMRLDLFSKILLAALAIEHDQASSRVGEKLLSRIRPMARARRRHSLVFSTNCLRPFGVRV